MTSYEKIVKWHTTDDPSFTQPKNRFYYEDLNDRSEYTLKLNYIDMVDEWNYIEAKYLCNYIDAVILDTVFAKNAYNVNYSQIDISLIPNICGYRIYGNPNLDLIVQELSDHYDKRGFYNLIFIENKYNILTNTITDNKVFRIIFFKDLPTNPKTLKTNDSNDSNNSNNLDESKTFQYTKRLLYTKITTSQNNKDNHIDQNKNKKERENNFYLYDDNILNDPSYKFVIDRTYSEIFNTFALMFHVLKEKNVSISLYCHDTLLFTIDNPNK